MHRRQVWMSVTVALCLLFSISGSCLAGSRIAFTSDRTGDWEVYVMDACGANLMRLTDSPGQDGWHGLSWSPDGARIVFDSKRDGNDEIYVMDADGSNQTRYTDSARGDACADWSPDGTRFAFHSARETPAGDIFVMDAVPYSPATKIADSASYDSDPDWHPAGTRIAWSAWLGGEPERDVWIMDPDGSNKLRLTTTDAYDAAPVWSPDGSKIAFTSRRDGNFDIYVMNADGSGQVNLTENSSAEDAYPSWSPDGTMIAFCSNRDPHPDNYDIYVMDAGNGDILARLTTSPGNDLWPEWSPHLPANPPVLGEINGPVAPVPVNAQVVLSVTFTDPDVCDTHAAQWTWDDGTGSPGLVDQALDVVTGVHSYDSPGVYTVGIVLTDSDGLRDEAVFQHVVVYDPSAGFVTGGGWIDSPAGAYAPDPSLSGKANFGFVAKYKKGADVPTGQTEFRFAAGDLNFHSTSYQWLVVAGPQAKLKGLGTLNSSGTYGFMLTARDGDLLGGDTDKFRVKIWDIVSEYCIYDNQMGDDDEADATDVLEGGSIVIHKGD